MAELVDAHGSGPCKITLVGVRFPLPAPVIVISVVIASEIASSSPTPRNDGIASLRAKRSNLVLNIRLNQINS